MSESKGGAGSVFMAEQKHMKCKGISAPALCACACVGVCIRTHVTDILVSSVSTGHRG